MFSCKLTKLVVREALLTQHFYRKVYKKYQREMKMDVRFTKATSSRA